MADAPTAATRPFSFSDPLPGPGTTVIEASAGTGKTATLAGLVTRFLAEGLDPDRLLAVTFTRMATGELRERIRQRVSTAEATLGQALAAGWPGAGSAGDVPVAQGGAGRADELVAQLLSGSAGEVAVRHQRLADALAGFDAVTITTTHGFCQLVLSGLGSAGDVDVGATLLEDPTDLVDEVVADLYLRHARLHGRPGFGLGAARAAARAAVANPDAKIVPAPAGAALLSRLASRARAEVARRLQEENLLTYDHLLERLSRTLEHHERGPAACDRLRRRYRVVLVDEFQDTDPVQWRVLEQAFGGAAATLVLIGDPKQAIYAFRGADVYAYLAANRDAQRLSLETNWRSDQPLLDATAALLSPTLLGHREIPFRPVSAPPERRLPSLEGAPRPAPIRVRVVPDRVPDIRKTDAKQLHEKASAVEWIADDVARDVAALLGSAATVMERGRRRAVEARDVAVLTRTNQQALHVRDALRSAGVPAVVAGLENVFATEAARDWLRLLDAVQEPAVRSRIVGLGLSSFVGMTAREVATADERRWEDVHDRAHRWAVILAARGVAALHRAIIVEEQLSARLLAVEGGERMVTDLQHVAELLHAESVRSQLSGPALRGWLAARLADADDGRIQPEERSRRLDSDADAVAVLTVHRAKGLEFGIVHCPYLWDPGGGGESPQAPVLFHDPASAPSGDGAGSGGRPEQRFLDVGAPDRDRRAEYRRHLSAALGEQRGEDLRILYVALTRARHQVVLWWARAHGCRTSPLGRLLVARAADGEVGLGPSGEPDERRIRSALERLAARAPGLLVVETAGPNDSRPLGSVPSSSGVGRAQCVASSVAELAVAEWSRELDADWRRASYSSIVAAAHDARVASEPEDPGVGSEPEDPGVGDEPAGDAGQGGGAARGTGTARHGAGREEAVASRPGEVHVCPLADVPRGREVGTLVHRLLEAVDFDEPDLQAAFASEAVRADPGGLVGGDPSALATGLAAALGTPLGGALGTLALRDVQRADRLDELAFELPMAGGDHPHGVIRTADVARVLRRHLPDGEVLQGYDRRLADPLLAATLRGYLTGSLDLVFRRRMADGTPRWFVADYKTNWLASADETLTPWHYRRWALDAEMQRQHYPLQALLYLVALHRYLRWRLASYDPDRHLGGALYLFLRGMVGPGTPMVDGHPCGVFTWAPSPQLVVDISDLFDRGVR